MVWRFHRSIFLMVVEMKEMVSFDMGEDSCGLTKVENRLKENKGKLFSLWNKRTWSHLNGGQSSMFITCTMSHVIPFLSFTTLSCGFRGHHGNNHCNVFSLILLSCMQNSTNEESFYWDKKRVNVRAISAQIGRFLKISNVIFSNCFDVLIAMIRMAKTYWLGLFYKCVFDMDLTSYLSCFSTSAHLVKIYCPQDKGHIFKTSGGLHFT